MIWVKIRVKMQMQKMLNENMRKMSNSVYLTLIFQQSAPSAFYQNCCDLVKRLKLKIIVIFFCSLFLVSLK